jgi:outer membrane protein OmpA-like peptidoglycan-associated protein
MDYRITLSLVATAIVVTGCSSSIRHYTDRRPITVTAERPAPPPPPAPAPIERIEVEEAIYFHNGSARLLQDSLPVIDEVAHVIEQHPEIELLRVAGHTDRAGNSGFNLRLSQRRAEAVRERLIEAGIEAERLEAVGYGDAHPIATNDTRVGRTQNRRVEFVVVDQEG